MKFMKKEEVLAAARKEKFKGKEFENNIVKNSYGFGIVISLIPAILILTLEGCIRQHLNFGVVSVLFFEIGAQSVFEGVNNRKSYLNVIGTLIIIMAIMALLVFIWELITL